MNKISSEKPSPTRYDSNQQKSEWSGLFGALVLLCLGGTFAVGGWNLGLGQITRIGPGGFPFGTGVLLVGLSFAIIVLDYIHRAPKSESADWVSFVAIAAALAVFGASVERVGLVPGVFATVIVASLPDRSLSLKGKAVLGACVALSCWAIFVIGLNLPFKPLVGL